MKRSLYILGAGLAALALTVGTARASTVAANDAGRAIHFNSEAAAKDPASGIPSFVFAPGTTTTFDYPTSTGRDVVEVSGERKARSFDALITGWTFTYTHYILGSFAWRWKHYTEWSYNGQCIVNKLANTQWSGGAGPAWEYRGAGGYFIWTINPPCYPLGTLWSGNQGHYSYIYVFEHEYPWELGEAYATGNYRTYDYGYTCNGLCS